MKWRSLLLVVFLIVVTIFVLLNLEVIMRTTTLELGFASVQAPLGVVMVGIFILSFIYFLIYALYLRTVLLIRERKLVSELETAQDIAEKAELSRFNELKNIIEIEFEQLENKISELVTDKVKNIENDKNISEQEDKETN